jgi:hypothetical protein
LEVLLLKVCRQVIEQDTRAAQQINDVQTTNCRKAKASPPFWKTEVMRRRPIAVRQKCAALHLKPEAQKSVNQLIATP